MLDDLMLWEFKINGLAQVYSVGPTVLKMYQTTLKRESLERLVEAFHTASRVFGNFVTSLPYS